MTRHDCALSEFSKKLEDIANAITVACTQQRLERVPALVSAHLGILTECVPTLSSWSYLLYFLSPLLPLCLQH